MVNLSNAKMAGMALAAGTVSAAAVIGTTLGASKLTGKPVGAKGSPAHIMTNPNLSKKDKVKTNLEINKEYIKDSFKIAGAAAGAAGVAAAATGVSKGLQGKVKQFVSEAGKALSEIPNGESNLKEAVKSSNLGKKFLNAPTPVKAGIIAGAAALAVVAPIVNICSISKAGYIEGKNEGKNLQTEA